MNHSMIMIAATFTTASFLGGCATTGTEFPTIYESNQTSRVEVEKKLTDIEALARIHNFVPYAKMSEAVYRRDLGKSWSSLQHACDYVGGEKPASLTTDLPADWKRLDKKTMIKLGMEAATAADPLRPCRAGKGLEYETYVKFDETDRPLAATIAFRGTENIKHEWRTDWIANFSNVDFGLGGNAQFSEARKEGMRLIEALSRVLPKTTSSEVCKAVSGQREGVQVPIELVGHSLGGGLAQHLAYSSKACDVRSTVTFDPSPATGWFFLNLRKLVLTKDPVIYRVYIDGEALSFVRKVSTKFNLPRDNRLDVRMVFPGVDVGAFGRHSMTLLYGGLVIASDGRPPASVDERVNYASREVYPEVSTSN
jgi:hypothetical protein